MLGLSGGSTSDFYFFLLLTYITFIIRNFKIQHRLQFGPQVVFIQGFRYNWASFTKLMDKITSYSPGWVAGVLPLH